MTTSYVIVEDHVLFAQAFRFMMNEMPNFVHEGTINNSEIAVTTVLNIKPNYLFIDINMPKISGIEVIKQVKSAGLSIKIIVVSMITDALVIAKALDAGADGYIPKNTDFDELQLAIKTIENGEIFVPENFKESLTQVNAKHQNDWEERNTDEKVNLLSQREIEIVGLIAKGYTNIEIADRLFLSPLTVKTHRTNILRKLGLKNSASLISFATQVGWA